MWAKDLSGYFSKYGMLMIKKHMQDCLISIITKKCKSKSQ
jgi:hypothetical protein